MKRVINVILCITMLVGTLTACGGAQDATTGTGGTVSGSAIRGSAVSQTAVTQQHVSASSDKTDERRFYNDTNFYYVKEQNSGDFVIVEKNLKSGDERQVKHESLSELCYVDNDWLYYLIWTTEEGDLLYRAPIKDGKVAIQKSEKILVEPEGIVGSNLYCDGEYFLYVVAETGACKKYDMEKREYVKELPYLKKRLGEGVEIYAVKDNKVFFEITDSVDMDGGYWMEMDVAMEFDNLHKITDEAAIFANTVAVTDSDFIYLDAYGAGIWQYNFAKEGTEEIVTEKQMGKMLVENGFLKAEKGIQHGEDFYVSAVFVSRNRLYLQMDVRYEQGETEYRNKAIFYYDLHKRDGLCYDKELTECLVNPRENQKEFNKIYYARGIGKETVFLSRGRIVKMNDKTCYLHLYNSEKDKNMLACYDYEKATLTYPTKKDMEWYLPYYEPSANWYGTRPEYEPAGDDDSMPNNEGSYWDFEYCY